jgi:hypothetical protein
VGSNELARAATACEPRGSIAKSFHLERTLAELASNDFLCTYTFQVFNQHQLLRILKTAVIYDEFG